MNKNVKMPFEGFYESNASMIIDDAIESELENNKVNYDDISFNHYAKVREQFALDYVSAFQEIMENEFDITIELKFNSIESPKEYNFETDSIYVEIKDEDINKLHKTIMEDSDLLDQMRETTKSLFDNRDGFSSFYANFSKTFMDKDINDWDENEMQSLFATMGDAFEKDSASLVSHMDNWSAFESVKDLAREKTNVAIEKFKKKENKNKHGIK